jgi:uncharacterized membrane protein YheB (UPF0754 family)
MKYLLLTACILLSLFSVSAQEKIIDKAEFDKVMSGNYRALRNAPNRTIEESVTENSFGSPMKTRTVTERVGTTSRNLYESDSATSSMKTETIFINGKRFVRKQDNPWIEEKFENKVPQNSFDTISDETTYKSLGEQNLNDKKVKVYQTVQIRKTVSKEKGNEFLNKNTITYYFDESGLMFKSEAVWESVFKPKNEPGSAFVQKETKSTRKQTQTVEIDQNIKIEEPKIG